MPSQTYPNSLYALLRPQSSSTSQQSGLTVLPLGPHISHRGVVRVAALGLAAEHGAATFAFKDVAAVPVSIAISQRGIGPDVASLELVTALEHQGRSVMVTTVEAFAGNDRDRRLAFGTITWSVLPTAPGTRSPTPGVSAVGGDLLRVAGIEDVQGHRAIRGAHSGIAGPGGILHAGALQALAEDAALAAVHDTLGAAVRVRDATFYFLRAARRGPFVARPRLVPSEPGECDVDVDVIDSTERLCTLARIRVRAETT